MAHVTIYTTSTCQYCKMTKAYFRENNITYEEKDVTTDVRAAEEMFHKSEQMGVPVIVVEKEGNEKIVVGFQKDKLSKLLKIKN